MKLILKLRVVQGGIVATDKEGTVVFTTASPAMMSRMNGRSVAFFKFNKREDTHSFEVDNDAPDQPW